VGLTPTSSKNQGATQDVPAQSAEYENKSSGYIRWPCLWESN